MPKAPVLLIGPPVNPPPVHWNRLPGKLNVAPAGPIVIVPALRLIVPPDRKSTRLNSSHEWISYAVFCLMRSPRRCTLFPYTTLFRSVIDRDAVEAVIGRAADAEGPRVADRPSREPAAGPLEQVAREVERGAGRADRDRAGAEVDRAARSEEHTSELQSRVDLVCRLLLDALTTQMYTLSLHDALPICY